MSIKFVLLPETNLHSLSTKGPTIEPIITYENNHQVEDASEKAN